MQYLVTMVPAWKRSVRVACSSSLWREALLKGELLRILLLFVKQGWVWFYHSSEFYLPLVVGLSRLRELAQWDRQLTVVDETMTGISA